MGKFQTSNFMKIGFLLIGFVFSFVIVVYCQGLNNDSLNPPQEEFLIIDEPLLDSGGAYAIWGIQFRLGSYEILDTNDFRILAIANYLLKHPTYIIEISVHRDCRGSQLMSQRLTTRRAQSIKLRLAQLGIEKGRVIAVGFDESQPYIADGIVLTYDYIAQFPKPMQEELHQKNRRVEIRVLNKDFVLHD